MQMYYLPILIKQPFFTFQFRMQRISCVIITKVQTGVEHCYRDLIISDNNKEIQFSETVGKCYIRIYFGGRKLVFMLTDSIAHLWIQLKLHSNSASYTKFIYVKENRAEFIVPGDCVFIANLQLQHILQRDVKNIVVFFQYCLSKNSVRQENLKTRLSFSLQFLKERRKKDCKKHKREGDLGAWVLNNKYIYKEAD